MLSYWIVENVKLSFFGDWSIQYTWLKVISTASLLTLFFQSLVSATTSCKYTGKWVKCPFNSGRANQHIWCVSDSVKCHFQHVFIHFHTTVVNVLRFHNKTFSTYVTFLLQILNGTYCVTFVYFSAADFDSCLGLNAVWTLAESVCSHTGTLLYWLFWLLVKTFVFCV